MIVPHVLSASLWFLICMTTHPPLAVDVPLTVTMPSALRVALRNGDREAIRQLVSTHAIGQVTAALSIAQLNYRLQTITAIGSKCQKTLVSKKTHGHLVAAFYCNALVRSASISRGDVAAFLRAADFAEREILPGVSREHHKQFSFGDGLDKLPLDDLAKAAPSLTLQWRSARERLATTALESGVGHISRAGVGISINGVHAIGVIRPSSGLVGALTIITGTGSFAAVYAKFGLKLVVAPLWQVRINVRGGSHLRRSQLAMARSMRIGPLTMHNVGIVVVQSSELPAGIYLGMSLFARFGEVAIGKHYVTLAKRPFPDCTNMVPMTFAAPATLNGVLQFPIQLNGAKAVAAWRPALRTPLAIDPAVLRKVADGAGSGFSTTGGSAPAPTPLVVTVGKAVLRPKSTYTPRSWNYAYQLAIGKGSLTDHTVFLRFDGTSPSIGFCNRSPAPLH